MTYNAVNGDNYLILTEVFFDVSLFVLDNEAEAAASSLHTGVCCLSRMHPSSGESSQSACA